MTFEELIQREHEAIAAALAHADVPHIQVITELGRQQNLMAFNAIPYQVCLLLQSQHLVASFGATQHTDAIRYV